MSDLGDVQVLVQEIGSIVASKVPQGWKTARVRAELHDDNSIIEASYKQSAAAPESTSFALGRDGRKVIERLREQMRPAKAGAAWKVMLLTLSSDGTIKLDFEYDDPSRWNENPYRSYDKP